MYKQLTFVLLSLYLFFIVPTTVTSTTSSVTALEYLRTKKEEFDIVLSDVHMPDIDGFKLLEQIALEIDIPVLMMSGNADQSVVLRGIIHGAVDYLLKPVRIHELKNIWQHVVRKNGTDSLQRSGSMSMSPARSGRTSPEKESGMNATSNGTPSNKKLRTMAAANNAVSADTSAVAKGNKKASMVEGVAELQQQQQQQQQTTNGNDNNKNNNNDINTAPAPVVGAAGAGQQQQNQMNVAPYPNAGAAPGGAPGVAVAPGHAGGGHPPMQSHHQQHLDGSIPQPVGNMIRGYVENGMPQGVHPQYHPQGGPPPMGYVDSNNMMSGGVGNGAGATGAVDMNGMPMQGNGAPGAGQPGGNVGGGSKKPRVVWSAELHQQFVNAVNQLGIDKAVPKRILDLMNVQGLTRENVASHLQKYRLYLKRLQGGPNNPSGPGFLSNKVAGGATGASKPSGSGKSKNNASKVSVPGGSYEFHPGAGAPPQQWNQGMPPPQPQQQHQQHQQPPHVVAAGGPGGHMPPQHHQPHYSTFPQPQGIAPGPPPPGTVRYSYGPVPIDASAFTPIPLDFDDTGLGLGASKGGFGSKSTDDMLSMFLKDGDPESIL